jgi:formylglycine-generating enzyme required for sulfatase activity
MSHIFISYNKQDHKYASQLADDLIHRGFDVWIDDRIDYGDRWWRTIVKAIQDCSAFIVIMTPNSDQSKWVEREVLLADQLHKPPFPILLAGNAFPIYVNTQWVDLRNRQLPPDRYYQRLRQVITPKDSTGQYIATPPKPTHLKRRIKLNEAWAIIIAAIITGIFAIAAALIATNNGDNNNTSSSNDPTATNQIAAVFSSTPERTNTDTPQPTNTLDSIPSATTPPEPTSTHTPQPTATPSDPAIALAENGVSSNAEWEPYSPYIQEFNGVEMVLVPAGCFMMGSTDEQVDVALQICEENDYTCERSWFEDEQPAHRQCFDEPFWIDRTEVTRAQYEECVTAGDCTDPPKFTDSIAYSIRDTQPINNVTWFQASDYCRWRGAHLPTELEWEYAARGPNNLIFPWGNDFVTNNVIYVNNSGYEIADSGSRPNGASWVGALDMSGNVWEWVSSLYQSYEYSAIDGREDMENRIEVRGMRGGSFTNGIELLRTATRGIDEPFDEGFGRGVRCVHLSVSTPSSYESTNTSSTNPVIALAENGVSSNTEWELYSPFIQEFNGVEMVLVPAGCFMMGSDDGESDERPVRQQCFDEPFWIDRTEVTRAQYAECVVVGDCTEPPSSVYSTRDDQPINRVTWYQARDYCAWHDAHLPTEREWEYAARGPNNLAYPWGNDFVGDNVVYFENSSETVGVGSRPNGVSWIGALDMSGNVREWVSSLYRIYEYNTNDGREDSTDSINVRVLRGGAFNYYLFDLRATYRFGNPAYNEDDGFGFRCARSYSSSKLSVPIETLLIVNIASANLRSGPGTNYEIVGNTVNGEQFTAIEQISVDGDLWYKIERPNNEFAWISSTVVDVESE